MNATRKKPKDTDAQFLKQLMQRNIIILSRKGLTHVTRAEKKRLDAIIVAQNRATNAKNMLQGRAVS